MNEPLPPTQVAKRDGRIVAFDADRISQALFAATESIGVPDAFLARELADSVVHFLAQECSGIPTTQEIADIVVKVVRALGQSALASAFEEHGRNRPRLEVEEGKSDQERETSLASMLADCARHFTLQNVFTRDLAAAQEAGLLTLTGLQHPGELASRVLGPPISQREDVLSALEQSRRFVGGQVALDGLEHLSTTNHTPRELAAAIALGLRLTNLDGVVNLDCGTPPTWAGALASGPLFAAAQPDRSQLREKADALLEEFLSRAAGETLAAPARLRIDWHVSESSFADGGEERLLGVARAALEGAPITFVFDRPRRRIALAEGLYRGHPATLLTVGLHLPVLARQPGMLADRERFLQRLGSLVRLALSAAVQKRQYLRRQAPALTSNFLLDRARFVVTPVGLDEVVHLFSEWGLCNGGESLEFGKQIVRRLLDVLHKDGRSAQMDACLDGPTNFGLAGAPARREDVAGLTPWDAAAPVRSQVRAAGVLHGLAEQGTLALFVPRDGSVESAELIDCLRGALQTDVVRLHVLQASGAG
jgi:hypothetical protein